MTKKAHHEAHEPETEMDNQSVEQPVAETTADGTGNNGDTEEQPSLEPAVENEYEEMIGSLNVKLADMTDKYLRLSADFDNYRKRTLKEKAELITSGGEGVLKNIIPLVDDFERAMAHIDTAQDMAAMREGIELIYGKFVDFLTRQGIKAIDAKDQPFDTDLHEAITKIPAPTPEMKGKVIDCVEKGYLLNEKVIRFSKVVVGE